MGEGFPSPHNFTMRSFIQNRSFVFNAILLFAALVLSNAIGAVLIPPATILAGLFGREISQTIATILYEIRLPHSLLIALTGAALSVSGTAYQGLFRNPLADPYLIGVASGAALGAPRLA